MQFHGVFGSTATEVSREQIDWVESKRRELLSCLILLPLINVSPSAPQHSLYFALDLSTPNTL